MPEQTTIQEEINSDISSLQLVAGSISSYLESIDNKKTRIQQNTQKIDEIKLDIESALEEVGIIEAPTLFFEEYADQIRRLELPFSILVPMFQNPNVEPVYDVSGIFLMSNGNVVRSAFTMTGGTVGTGFRGNRLEVFSSGTSISQTVSNGGSMNIYGGGTVRDVVITTGGSVTAGLDSN